jgi:hypothetical protein
MDALEQALTQFAPLPNEPLDNFVRRLQLSLDDYNRRALYYNLPNYSDRATVSTLATDLTPVSDRFLFDNVGVVCGHDFLFLPFTQVSQLLQDRVRFDLARRASPVLLNCIHEFVSLRCRHARRIKKGSLTFTSVDQISFRATRALERVYLDFFFAGTELDFDNETVVLYVLDEATRYTWVHPISTLPVLAIRGSEPSRDILA